VTFGGVYPAILRFDGVYPAADISTPLNVTAAGLSVTVQW